MAEIMDVKTEPVKTAQTPAPDTEPTGWMSPTGEIREGAPENVKTLLEAKKWNNVEQIVDGYNELGAFKGIAEIMENVPTTVDGYEYTYSGEGESPINDELLNGFFQLAHTKKWPKQFVQDVIDFQLDAIAGQAEAYNTQLASQKEENIKILKQKWGEANYEVKVRDARIVADKLGIYETLEAKGLASDPDIISMLDNIASKTAEDVITPPTPPVREKSLQEQLEEIEKSESFIQKFHPEHKETMAKFLELNQMIADSRQRPVSRQV